MVTTPTSLLVRLRSPADQAAWERFVKLYTPVLYGWIRRQGIGLQEATDLVQEVFATTIAVLPTFEYDRQKGFGNWLCTLTTNKCRDYFRRAALRKTASWQETSSSEPDPAVLFSEAEYRKQVARRALELMQSEFETTTWKACYLMVVEGLGAQQVASQLGITTNAVYLAKSRVLRRLRQELDGLLE